MRIIKKIMMVGAVGLLLPGWMQAEETMVYDLRVQSNFDINRQFSVDKDEEPWMWARYTVGGEDVSAPEQYNSSYTDGYYSSAYYTPDLNLAAGNYRIYLKPRKKNSDAATKPNPDLRILLGQGAMTESAYNSGAMTEIGHITAIPYASTYSEADFKAVPVQTVDFTITTPGNYKIAFFNKGAAMTLHGAYIVATDGSGGGTVTPDPGTDPDNPTVDPDDPNKDPDDPNVDPDDPNKDPDDPEDPDTPMANVSLPFADSFAGATLDKTKWKVETAVGAASWSAAAVVLPGQFLGNWTAQDEDGGLAVYDGWNGKAGDYGRLITAPITKASSTAPVVDFWFRHSHSRGCKNYIKVQVSADGGDWQDVADAQIFTYREDMDDGGWENYVYTLVPYIEGCETYRVAFTGYTDGISTYLPVDNVNIYNMADKDVRIISATMAEEVAAGHDIEIAVTLENMGGAAVKAADYTVTAESEYPFEVEFTSVDIPSLGTATLVGKAKATAEEVLNGPDYTFTVNVNVPGNSSDENLVSAPMETTVCFVDHKSPLSPKAETGDGGEMNLSWGSVVDLNHKALSISENFNALQAREQIEVDGEKVWKDGVKGDFNGFISLDFDKQDGGSYYSTSGSEFMVFKDFMTGSMPQGHSGQYIGLTLPANIQQDDWLISPELDAAESSLIYFWARIAYIHREGDQYNNSIEVLYSTEDYDKKNPSASFKKSLYSNVSKATSGDLPHDGLYHWLYLNEVPAEAKYVALHFNTKSGMQTGVWIDRIQIGEKDQYPLKGYYVYKRNEGRLNETPLAKETLQYAISGGSGQPDLYYVTALYEDGESAPTTFNGGSAGAVEIEAAENGEVRYYNLQGVEVRNPERGSVVIRVKGGKAEKILF